MHRGKILFILLFLVGFLALNIWSSSANRHMGSSNCPLFFIGWADCPQNNPLNGTKGMHHSAEFQRFLEGILTAPSYDLSELKIMLVAVFIGLLQFFTLVPSRIDLLGQRFSRYKKRQLSFFGSIHRIRLWLSMRSRGDYVTVLA